jgi:hypothetical protein
MGKEKLLITTVVIIIIIIIIIITIIIIIVQINQPTKCNSFSSLLLDVYLQLNMFRASPRPSSGAQQLQ